MGSKEAFENVQQGYRMPKPDTCPSEIYDVILSCWSTNPPSRPSFDFLNTFLHDWQSPSWPKCSLSPDCCALLFCYKTCFPNVVIFGFWASLGGNSLSDLTQGGVSFYRRGGIDKMWAWLNILVTMPTSICCNVFRVTLFHGWDLANCSKLALTVLPKTVILWGNVPTVEKKNGEAGSPTSSFYGRMCLVQLY